METPVAVNSDKGPAPDSRQAWLRLAATMLVSTIGGVGMWSVVVALPAVQAEFAVPRAQASLPFTMAMLGFAVGGVVMGRLLDAAGIVGALTAGALALCLGYLGAASAGSLVVFALAHAIIGFGTSVTFGPLMADIFILVCPPPRRGGDVVFGRKIISPARCGRGGAARHRGLWLGV